jgi:hypothetical protein
MSLHSQALGCARTDECIGVKLSDHYPHCNKNGWRLSQAVGDTEVEYFTRRNIGSALCALGEYERALPVPKRSRAPSPVPRRMVARSGRPARAFARTFRVQLVSRREVGLRSLTKIP